MKSYEEMDYHPQTEQIVKVLMQKTENDDPLFFRVLTSFYFSVLASMMRTSIDTKDRGSIPVSMYAINLAPSGAGKGHSTNILEEQVLQKFKNRYFDETFPQIALNTLTKLAITRSTNNGTDLIVEQELLEDEYLRAGELPFTFDSGTPAAVKQVRHKLLLANAGSMNFIMDEVGANLQGNIDLFNAYIELYDTGKIKSKLTKNTAENTRGKEIDGRTPANMMLFGTPVKLFDGGKTEDMYLSLQEMGYARRCIYGLSPAPKGVEKTPEEVLKALMDTSMDSVIHNLADALEHLADPLNFGNELSISHATTLIYIEYKLQCEKLAREFSDHQETQKAEMAHRYFKALKLAGAYAFIDRSSEVLEEHLYAAIKLVEDSGVAFTNMFKRERNYVKLAKYLANVSREVTHVDLMEDLPFYKGSESQKRELMNLATAYGRNQNIVIKKTYADGIEFFQGESLKTTDTNKIIYSYSDGVAHGFYPDPEADVIPFKELHTLVTTDDLHWCNHRFKEGHREEDDAIKGFNLLILDVEKSVSIPAAMSLLEDYTYLIHTTKRHTEEEHRYRVIIPLSHELYMDKAEYKEFMANIFESLPFPVDAQTNQRARKWLTSAGDHYYNDGKLFNALDYIPKTSKNEERASEVRTLASLDNLERWFALRMSEGQRSNEMIKYAYMLADSGMPIQQITSRVLDLNDRLADKLPELELRSTVLISAEKRVRALQGGA